MFQEVLNGVMAVRSCGEADRAAVAAKLRLGHIPGGSTDAVAYSLNGTRSAATAALHVALGDRSVLGKLSACIVQEDLSSIWRQPSYWNAASHAQPLACRWPCKYPAKKVLEESLRHSQTLGQGRARDISPRSFI